MSKLDMIKEKLNLNKKKIVMVSIGMAVIAVMGGSLVIYEEYREKKLEQKNYSKMLKDINLGKSIVESVDNVSNTQDNSPNVNIDNIESNEIKTISRTEALNIALNNLNITKNDAKCVEISLDYDYDKRSNERRYVYEVEFIHDWVEYSYDIDAITGKIVGMDMDSDLF